MAGVDPPRRSDIKLTLRVLGAFGVTCALIIILGYWGAGRERLGLGDDPEARAQRLDRWFERMAGAR
jgi:hypothetical protein